MPQLIHSVTTDHTPAPGNEHAQQADPHQIEPNRRTERPAGWPKPLDEAALYGLAGDLVRIIDPHTEADPAGILVQFLVALGNVVGRNPYFLVEATHHYLNLFAALVGDTSKARKGTSWGQVDHLYQMADSPSPNEGWPRRTISGLASGEGLIWEVRDPRDEADAGVIDKRRVVVDGEFAATLKILGREGNTLSPVIRNAWDSGNLWNLTKNSRAHATAAHISIVAHITRDELRRELTSSEMANGFANRFLWTCVTRSKLLPDGGNLCQADLEDAIGRLRDVLGGAINVGQMQRDDDARRLWHALYEELSAPKPGMLGAVIARAEAQVIRLSCLYALLDQSPVIRVEHLKAAHAVWNYCEASARFIFGNATGDPVADRILDALRYASEGLSRTGIRDLFQRNESKQRIDEALALLTDRKLAAQRLWGTGSRQLEMWVACR